MRAQVLNNCQGPHYLQHNSQDGGKTLGSLVVLHPGMNLIDTKELATLRKNPGVEMLFTTKIKPTKAPEANVAKFHLPMLQVVGKELKDGLNPFDGLSLDESKAIISATENTDALDEWLRPQKSGSELAKAISERLKEITSGIDPQAA